MSGYLEDLLSPAEPSETEEGLLSLFLLRVTCGAQESGKWQATEEGWVVMFSRFPL